MERGEVEVLHISSAVKGAVHSHKAMFHVPRHRTLTRKEACWGDSKLSNSLGS